MKSFNDEEVHPPSLQKLRRGRQFKVHSSQFTVVEKTECRDRETEDGGHPPSLKLRRTGRSEVGKQDDRGQRSGQITNDRAQKLEEG
jgi:hypothetical protein